MPPAGAPLSLQTHESRETAFLGARDFMPDSKSNCKPLRVSIRAPFYASNCGCRRGMKTAKSAKSEERTWGSVR